MNARFALSGIVPLVVLAVLAGVTGVTAKIPQASPTDITATTKGKELVASTADRFSTLGLATDPASLRAWELRPGEYVVAERMPLNLVSRVVTGGNGTTRIELTYDLDPGREPEAPRLASAGKATAASPSWVVTSQRCFNWIQNDYGELLPCYKVRKMVNETWPRDYYGLEQYGTVQAKVLSKIYDGWVAAQKAPSSSSMLWEEWDPLGDINGSCQTIPLSISVNGIGFSANGFMCERWDMTLYQDAGHFKQMWSCGCIWPFGQPYPNSRGMKYLQAVSVPGGGSAIWTLSAGFLAAPGG